MPFHTRASRPQVLGTLALLALAPAAHAQAPAAIRIDAAANRHPISPLVYGVAYGDAATLPDLNCPLNRQGGNNTSRYNWQLNADNKGSDYFFESIGDPSATPGERGDTFVATSRAAGAQPMLTLPMLDWVANLGAGRAKLSSFSVAKYGPQQATDFWMPDAGNGVLTGGADVPNSVALQQGWAQHLVGRWGAASAGGLKYYLLDNEPSIWFGTHRDVHPTGATMDEILQKTEAYAAMVKAADPSALTMGPEEWGWSGYLYSGYDQQYGALHGWGSLPDRAAHGGVDYLPWLLGQLRLHDQSTGVRSLDVFSVHFYPQGGEYGNDTSTNAQLLRNRSTRQLWDPGYVSESWIGTPVQLIPRLKNWVAQYYPGLQTAVTEYNWGAEGSINGATAQADIFGIFGREGLDLATRWTAPGADTPTYKAMKLFRNYDGSKSGFGDTSVLDTAPDPDSLSSFAAVRSSDGALTVMVINKALTAAAPVSLSLANFPPGSAAQAWQLTSANSITRLGDVAVSGGSLSATLPAQSVTLFVVPVAPAVPLPATPTGLSAQGGNAQAALTWAASTGAASYNLYRSTTAGAETLLQSGLTATSFADTGLTNGTPYFYQVTAVNTAGTSPKSAEVSATPAAVPAALVNDTDGGITYVGAWNYSASRGVGDSQDDAHYATTNGDGLTYAFTGTGVGYVTETNSDQGDVDVYLDGAFQATVSCLSAARRAQQTVWAAAGLAGGSHTLRLVKRGGGYMLLDALSVVTGK